MQNQRLLILNVEVVVVYSRLDEAHQWFEEASKCKRKLLLITKCSFLYMDKDHFVEQIIDGYGILSGRCH